MSDKDYSLLRPFDLEAAKRGDSIVGKDDGEKRSFVTGPDKHGYFVVESADGFYRFGKSCDYRMAPLAWVEGKPVYKGDVLWHSLKGKFVVAGIFEENKGHSCGPSFSVDGYYAGLLAYACTWTPPKVKREGWVNVYGYQRPCHIHATEELANQGAMQACGMIDQNRLACIRIEWEE